MGVCAFAVFQMIFFVVFCFYRDQSPPSLTPEDKIERQKENPSLGWSDMIASWIPGGAIALEVKRASEEWIWAAYLYNFKHAGFTFIVAPIVGMGLVLLVLRWFVGQSNVDIGRLALIAAQMSPNTVQAQRPLLSLADALGREQNMTIDIPPKYRGNGLVFSQFSHNKGSPSSISPSPPQMMTHGCPSVQPSIPSFPPQVMNPHLFNLLPVVKMCPDGGHGNHSHGFTLTPQMHPPHWWTHGLGVGVSPSSPSPCTDHTQTVLALAPSSANHATWGVATMQ